MEDTLVGFSLLPYSRSIRKRQRKNPKFYFFDIGVLRALSGELNNEPVPRTPAYGFLFENFIINEIQHLAKTYGKDWRFSYLMTGANLEIDLIIEEGRRNLWAIEIKSTEQVENSDVLKLESLAKDLPGVETLILSRDPVAKKISNTECLSWQEGLKKIFALIGG